MLCSANITTFFLVTFVACRTSSRRHYHAIKEQKRCELTEAAHIQSRICSEPRCKLLMNNSLCNRSEGLSYRSRRRNVTAGSRKLSADSQSNRTGVDDSKACCRSERSQGGVIYPPSTPPPLTAHRAYALPLAATVRKGTTPERDQLLFQCLYTQQQQCNNSERALHSDRSLDRTTSLHYNFQERGKTAPTDTS